MGVEENNISIPSFFDNISEPDTGGKGGDIISIKNTFETPLSHYSAQSKVESSIKVDNESGQHQQQEFEYQYGGDATHFPPSIKFILGNEIGERYSYYAMKTILNNYLINFMGYQSKTAEAIGHGFNAGAYFFTVFGAYVADARLGKFKTILYFSILYCIGAGCLALTAIPGITGPRPGERSPWGVIIGLGGIAIGTGGIKPVVSAFCGDQFGPHQKKLLTNLFQMFYWCVNLGSFFSSILSPILRTNVGYWCAFSVPAIILLISIVIFVLGNKKFIKRPPEGSIFSKFCKIIIFSIKEQVNKAKQGENYDDSLYENSWLDRSKSKFDPVNVDQVKQVLRVLLCFCPLPFFWALYDQTGTRWTTQGNSMNRKLGSITIDAEIINAINPLLVLIFVPIFEYCLYRPLQKRNVNFSPLRRMGTGMLLSVISFIIAAMLQLYIDHSPPNSVHIALQIPQYVVLTWAEILISITGLEFAYSNSPKNMKSIVMAGWLLTVSIGNLFDVFIISAIVASEFVLYVIFGSVMFIFIGIFVLIAYHFKSVDPDLMNALNGENNGIIVNSSNNSDNNDNSSNNSDYIRDNSTSIDNLSINDEEFNRNLNIDNLSDSANINGSKVISPNSKRRYIDESFLDIPSSSSIGRRNINNSNNINNNRSLDSDINPSSDFNNDNSNNNSNSSNNNTTRIRSLRNSNESLTNLDLDVIFNEKN